MRTPTSLAERHRGRARCSGPLAALARVVVVPRPRRGGLRTGEDERGVTMVEMLVVMLTLGILLGISLPIVATLLRTTSRVDVTYSNINEQLWLSTNLQRLVRSAVAAAPSSTSTVVPAFTPGTITPTSMTFTTNIGTPNGPVKITATCTQTPSNHTRCAKPTSTFTVTMTRPTAGTCPRTTSSNATCAWPTSAKHILVRVTHVRNGANGQPLFVFSYGAQPTPGQAMTTTTVCASAGTPAGCKPTTTDASVFNGPTSCKPGSSFTSLKPFGSCPAGEIETVNYDLQINANTSTLNGGNQAEDDTGVFVLSPTSMLFDPSVG